MSSAMKEEAADVLARVNAMANDMKEGETVQEILARVASMSGVCMTALLRALSCLVLSCVHVRALTAQGRDYNISHDPPMNLRVPSNNNHQRQPARCARRKTCACLSASPPARTQPIPSPCCPKTPHVRLVSESGTDTKSLHERT